jgi:hypothetical protein
MKFPGMTDDNVKEVRIRLKAARELLDQDMPGHLAEALDDAQSLVHMGDERVSFVVIKIVE